ncbi:flocculation protein FLO11-like [Cucumis melo var. makuwa]|uniref:Flocculation protein FLO11-like n=1 Tax=Cucumis melo var. makuwa TaxID=1194695 RepID=A0A5D3CRF1_CUCMM|nr:flocculation protein FLO11-like [Cucumis melo var. makuwa]
MVHIREHLAEELTGGTVPVWLMDGLLSSFLLSQHPSILAPIDAVGTASRVIPLRMRLFQGSYVPDVPTDFDTPFGGSRGSSDTSSIVDQSLVVPVALGNRLLQALGC